MGLFKSGQRAGAAAGAMIGMAKVLSEDEVQTAVDYYAKLKPPAGYNKVVETDTVPKSYVGAGGMRLPAKDGGTEPIGDRIIVLPQDAAEAKLRDPHVGLRRLRAARQRRRGQGAGHHRRQRQDRAVRRLPRTGAQGLGEVPPIVGRTATYLFRQLNDIQTDTRKGPGVALMKPVVANLTQHDMIAIAAYVQSLAP